MLKVGSKAPKFSLQGADGKKVSLSSLKGNKVVLYFYSKDNTSGCTAQAMGYKEKFDEITEKGAVILGVSKDSVESHAGFKTKYNLPFNLLSDPNLDVIKEYEAWGEKKMCGKTCMGVIRTTYIIDEKGVIIDAETNVKGAENAEKVAAKL